MDVVLILQFLPLWAAELNIHCVLVTHLATASGSHYREARVFIGLSLGP